VSDVDLLPDLAARRLGGMVLAANDEFFAPKENLLKPEAPVFDPDRYTDRGKEMDGWETRRRRTPGHDWCVVRLGVPGIVREVLVDTSFFRGNYPDRCSVEGAVLDGDDLAEARWVELVPETALEGDAPNRFGVGTEARVTHVRLNIVPDGGVARLRVRGQPLPDLRGAVGRDGSSELAGTISGGVVVDASDRFFSSPDNLIAPGDSSGMHDGWETRRRRGPGHDWVTVGLAAEAEVDRVEVDTTNFKGNYPDTCSVEASVGGDEWLEVVERRALGPHGRFAFAVDPPVRARFVRLNIHPDGGVARLRVFGRVTDDGWRAYGVSWVNAQATEALERELVTCCGSSEWVRGMLEARPFADFDAVLERSDAVWAGLAPEAWLEAFAAHPRIGDREGSSWSRQEQSGTASASEDVRRALAEGNAAYEERFGHVFLINATDRSASEMLEALQRRLANDPETELAEAAEQQRQITRLRLDKLVRPPSLAPPASGGA
jgi:allantoicase